MAQLTFLKNNQLTPNETVSILGKILKKQFSDLKFFAPNICYYSFSHKKESFLFIKSKQGNIILKNEELDKLNFMYPDMNKDTLHSFIQIIKEITCFLKEHNLPDFIVDEENIEITA